MLLQLDAQRGINMMRKTLTGVQMGRVGNVELVGMPGKLVRRGCKAQEGLWGLLERLVGLLGSSGR